MTSTPLATVGEPAIEYTNNAGGVPGLQLRIDFDADGSFDCPWSASGSTAMTGG